MDTKMDKIYKKTIMIGKLKMSLFSFIIVIFGLIVGLLVSIKLNVYLGLLITLSSFISAYNVNCVIVGSCKIWAWILVTIFVLNSIINIFLNLMNNNKDEYKISIKKIKK